MAFIGFGKCSKYYIYILVVFICQLVCDILLYKDKEEEKKENNFEILFNLNNHNLLQDLLKFLGCILCGIIYYAFYIVLESNKKGEISISKCNELKIKYLGIKIQSINCGLSLIGFFYSFNFILETFLLSLDFNAKFWSLEIIFLILLSQIILQNKIGNHQILAVLLYIIILFILQIISSFLPLTKHNCEIDEECRNKYLSDNNLYDLIIKKFEKIIFIPIFIIINIINYIMRDYGWVKSKYLMDIRTVPFHKILIFIGLIGFLLIIILFPMVSFIPCNTFINVNINNYTYVENNEIKYIDFSKKICHLMDYDEKNKILRLYYDNFFILLKT